jgi:hypothetical protein
VSTDTNALVPVAWVDGCDLLNMGKGLEPTISGYPVSEHDVPLYGPDTIERLTRERDEAVARERERIAKLVKEQTGITLETLEYLASPIRTTKATT